MTVTGLINQALMLLGDLRPGYTASNDVLNTGMETANAILAAWAAEGNMVPQVTQNSHAMTGGVAVYTFGVGGNINSTRPIAVLAAKMAANNIPMPVEVIRSAEEWARVSIDDTATGNYAKALWVEYTQPQATVYLWPIPNVGSTLYLYSLKPLSSFAAVGDTVSLHPGYEHALIHAVAVEMGPKVLRPVPELVVAEAQRAKAALAAMNEAVLQAWAKEVAAQ